jgi:dihydrofolate reductase
VTTDPSSWATFDPDSGEEAAQALAALDGMLMGRGTYEYFADVMPQQTGPYADAINAIGRGTSRFDDALVRDHLIDESGKQEEK